MFMALGEVSISLIMKNVTFICYTKLCNFYFGSAPSNILIEDSIFTKIKSNEISTYQFDILNVFIAASGDIVIRNTRF